MKINAKYLLQIMALGLVWNATDVSAAPAKSGKESFGEIIFKIHDVVPEKNADGQVVYCNIGATFFNRTKADASNVSLDLVWNDSVIGDIIDIEDREEKESRREGSKEPRSRYSTAGFTSKKVSTLLKLPPIKMNQQITLKAKVDTDRCFILLEDMDISVVSCGTLSDSTSKGACNNYFRYVSPKLDEYYTEFKEISWEDQLVEEDNYIAEIQEEVDAIYKDAFDVIDNIVAPLTSDERNDSKVEEDKNKKDNRGTKKSRR